MDVSANNYDSEATADDGSCLYSLTVQVDMSEVGNVSPAGVHIAGAFQGWNPGATALQDGGNGIWSAVIEVPAGSFECKFINGNAWGNEESVPATCGTDDGVGGYNRVVAWAASEASTLPPVCFGECDPCNNDPDDGGTDAESTLTIQVNMEGIDVASSGVHIAGTWQGWDAGATPMTQISGTDVWIYTTPFVAGTYLRYKFINGNAWGLDESVPGACADGIDRFHSVGDSDEVLDAVCYGTCNVCPGPEPVAECLGDLNEDGLLNVGDMLGLLADFGCVSSCIADLDSDGSVTVSDVLMLLTLFGESCP